MSKFAKISSVVAIMATVLVTAFLIHPALVGAAAPQGALHKSTGRSILSGHLVPALNGAHASAALPITKEMTLSIALNLRNPQELHALLAAQNDPHSSSYHHYLTPQQFTA